MSLCCFGFETAGNPPPIPGYITSVSNTNSIQLGVALGNLTSDLIVDPNPLNVITVSPSGTLVQLSGKNISLFTNDVGYITGNQNITISGEASGSGTTNISLTLDNTSVISKVLTGLNIIGSSITATDSILSAFGKVQNQINGLLGGAIYQGVWNANTNSPALASGIGTKGYYYVVSVAGSTNLDGITDWKIGDWAIFNGTTWDKVDNTDSVSSVNGFIGAVNLTTTDIPEGLQLYYTNSRGIGSVLTGYVSGAGTVLATDTILQAIQKLNGNITAIPSYTFSTGITNTANIITNNLSTGIAGGQSVIGGTGIADVLTLKGTTGNGTSTVGAILLTVGNNGSTTALQALNSGHIVFPTSTSSSQLTVREWTSGTGFHALYFGTAAATNGNFGIMGTSTATVVNGSSSLTLQIGGSNVASLSSAQFQVTSAVFTQSNPAANSNGSSFSSSNSTLTGGLSQNSSTLNSVHTGSGFNSSIHYGISTQNRSTGVLSAGMGTGILFGLGYGSGSFINTRITSYATSAVSSSLNSAFGFQTSIAGIVSERFTFYEDKFGIGVPIPTAYLHLPSSTSTISSLHINSGISPVIPNDGDIWYDSTEKGIVGFIDGIKQYDNRVLFVQTANKNVSNSVVETSLFGTGLGSNTLPANFWTVGKTVEITIKGHEGALILASQTFNIYYGATLIGTTGNQQVNSALTYPEMFEITITITCRTIGATGTLIVSAMYKYHDGTTSVNPLQCVEFTPMDTPTTINTTTSNALDVRIQWGAASGTNTITSTIANIKVLK